MKYEDPKSLRLSLAELADTSHKLYVAASPLKRLTDLVLASLMLIAFLPLMCLIAICIKAVDGGPILFKHSRIGRHGRAFDCLKFRSMRTAPDAALEHILETDAAAREEWAETRKLKDDPRILPIIGKYLRASSLDELPQLFNILRGEMSLVGPRPVTIEELSLYGIQAGSYMKARPGLTGRWQVSGRNDLTFQQRVNLDEGYVRDANFWTDLKIILSTPVAVLRQRGAY